MKKKNEWIQKIFLVFLSSLLLFVLLLRPQANHYRDNQILLNHKRKIIAASRLEISEEEYLKQLNLFELELDHCRALIPEEEKQQCLYDGFKEVIKKSGLDLIELSFGTATIMEGKDVNEVADDEKKLYELPIKAQLVGDEGSIKQFFNHLKDACPMMTIASFNLEERQGMMGLDLELRGYFFQ